MYISRAVREDNLCLEGSAGVPLRGEEERERERLGGARGE